MKIAVNADTESSSTGVVSAKMQIDVTKQAKLFHMLSSSLYSNKPRSILRELCSNAHDSHVAAKIADTTPFKIVAPTIENPVLVVKDFGIGLSKEDAYETILCYLGSTKDTSSDFIGGWGVGSKSPFAYAKTYNVVCIKDGIRVEFACWKDSMGIPTEALLSETTTSEPNGVEMHVPIELGDVRNFNRVIRTYMEWTNYNVVSDFAGELVCPARPIETVMVGSVPVHLYINEAYAWSGGGVRLVYGGESYDIKSCIAKETDCWLRWERLLDSMHSSYRIAIVAGVPGSIDFNMNREELEHSENTTAFVSEVTDHLTAEAEARINAYDGKMKGVLGLAGSGSVDMTLGEVDGLIETIIAEGDAGDRVFAKAFRIFETAYTKNFASSVRMLSRNSGVYVGHAIRFKVAPLPSQVDFVYARSLKVPRYMRDEFFREARRRGDEDRIHVFVKADTAEDAIGELRKHSDFADLDLSKFEFKGFEIPVPVRITYAKKGRSSLPRIYDRETKRYITWDARNFYVINDPDMTVEERTLCRIGANLSNVNGLAFFTPTADFLKRDDIPGNVITAEEAIDSWKSIGENFCNTYGGLSLVGMQKFSRFSIDRINNRYAIGRMCAAMNESLKKFRSIYQVGTGGPDAAVYDLVEGWRGGCGPMSIHALVTTANNLRGQLTTFLDRTEYIEISELSRSRTKPSAKRLIAALKIEEWI